MSRNIDNTGLESCTQTVYRVACQVGLDDCVNCCGELDWVDSPKEATDLARYYGWSVVDDKWACPWCTWCESAKNTKKHIFPRLFYECGCANCVALKPEDKLC